MNLNSIKKRGLFLSGILLPLNIIMYRGIPYGFILFCLMCIVFFKGEEIRTIKINIIYFILLFLSIVTMIFACFGNMENSWKQCAITNFFLFICIVVMSGCIPDIIQKGYIVDLKKGIKLGCLFQIVWVYLQSILYTAFAFNINDFLFRDVFHFTDNVSWINFYTNNLSASGFGWHPAQLVPVIILSYFLFHDKIVIKLLLLGAAALSGNSTSLIAIFLCFFGELFIRLLNMQHKYSRKRIALILLVIAVGSVFVFQVDLSILLNSMKSTIERISMIFSGNITEMSTGYHVRYYTSLPQIIQHGGIIELLFGYGYECSGYPYTLVLNQYSLAKPWVPESDFINFLIGRGLIWTLIFYYWQLVNWKKMRILNKLHSLFYIIILVCGIAYNNQFLWVIVLELILACCNTYRIDFFTIKEGEKIWLK